MPTTRAPALDTEHLAPPDPAAIGRICVHAILGTSAARHVDLYQLTHLVQQHVVSACYGRTVDFNPVMQELLKMDRVTEEDLFIGLINMIECLSWLGVNMALPHLSLSEESRRHIIEAGEAATHSARAAFELRRLRAAIHRVEREQLGTLLVQGHHITQAQLEQGLEAQQRHGRRLGTNLVEMGFISAQALARFLGHQLELECVTRIDEIAPEVLALVPKGLALQYRVLPIGIDEKGRLQLAMEDPLDVQVMEKVHLLSGRVVHPLVAPETTLVYAMSRYYGHVQPSRVRGR
ncbi:MAG: hypothetical protein RIT81_04740 [Deltaproteobacteria bacterium]